MKQRIQGIIIGVLITVIVISSISLVSAAARTVAANLNYNDIKIVIDGELITPKDASGNVVEPFIYNGTTFLPVRAVGAAFGKEIGWDGDTQTVYIGERPDKPAIEVSLHNKAYLEVGNRNYFNVSSRQSDGVGFVWFGIDANSSIAGSRYLYKNHVVYPINMAATQFRAVLNPPANYSSPELTYKIYGDDTLIYTSPIMTHNVTPISAEVDIAGFITLKIEIEFTSSSGGSGTGLSATIGRNDARKALESANGYRGLENPRIVTTDY
ncbi:MAG: stalk domain-containing protein [Oscillospiraceae bacterium]|nr:stalk domain-containing protein [Oscillospiraceae bacterium]